MRRPVRGSQSRTTPSLPAVASWEPSALKATPLILRPCPRRMRLPWPVAESQICAPPSLPTVSSWLSPGRKAHAQAVPRWGAGCCAWRAMVWPCGPAVTVHSRTAPLLSQAARRLPSSPNSTW